LGGGVTDGRVSGRKALLLSHLSRKHGSELRFLKMNLYLTRRADLVTWS
jgi:hypothetical protein